MRIVCETVGGTLAFAQPLRVLRADQREDVAATLREADDARARGAYVAGFVSYEAGAALVPRQKRPARDVVPLVELGVYAAPSSHGASDASVKSKSFRIGPLAPLVTRSQYEAKIADVLGRIRDGEVYQVNLAVPFSFAFAGDARALYEELTRDATFPYCAFVESERYAIVSCSPELFVRFARDRVRAVATIETKPMKGTASLSDPGALANAKNRAEHVMIVDLLRNDLHRLSDDVTVERLFEVERYPTYATTTSTIVARRPRAFTLAETFDAMFPCGSITGAPKVTAMQTIAALETPRGAFCGSIGYVAPDGSGTWNVAIRTATIDAVARRGTVHVGGGIVADSNARDEWAEILVKRRFIDRVTPTFALLETMRREPDGAYVRLDGHLARLARSADALHFSFDESRIRTHLGRVGARTRSVLVRLEVDVDGRPTTTVRDFEDERDVRLMWSSAIVDRREPLQRFKTTWRPQYDIASEEATARGVFDAVLCNRNGAVIDGARVTLFVECADGTLVTPRASDGALPGILRAELLAAGRVREARVTRADVEGARAIFVGNSARGLVSAAFSSPDRYAAAIGSGNTGSRKNGMAIG